jgi:hypothetical protein
MRCAFSSNGPPSIETIKIGSQSAHDCISPIILTRSMRNRRKKVRFNAQRLVIVFRQSGRSVDSLVCARCPPIKVAPIHEHSKHFILTFRIFLRVFLYPLLIFHFFRISCIHKAIWTNTTSLHKYARQKACVVNLAALELDFW